MGFASIALQAYIYYYLKLGVPFQFIFWLKCTEFESSVLEMIILLIFNLTDIRVKTEKL